MGFVVVIFFFACCYTANLASILTNTSKSTNISNIKQAINQNVTICMHHALKKHTKKKYPSMSNSL